MMTDTAASLVEIARKAKPVFIIAAALGYCLRGIQQAGHPRLVVCVSSRLRSSCLVCLGHREALCAPHRWSTRPTSAHPLCRPLAATLCAPKLQSCCCCSPSCCGRRSRGVLADAVLLTSRAPPEVWGMSTAAACLLLSRYAPATARILAEFRRLRDSLPPAEASKFSEFKMENMQHAEMMTMVRLCACPTSRGAWEVSTASD